MSCFGTVAEFPVCGDSPSNNANNIVVTAEGGINLGNTSTTTTIALLYTASADVLVGGNIAETNVSYATASSGNITVSGTANAAAPYNVTGSGGIVVSGATNPTVSYIVVVSSGNATINSTANNATISYNMTSSGGIVIALATDFYIATGSGGIVVSGTASASGSVIAIIASGGIDFGGSSQYFPVNNYTLSGNVKTTGITTLAAIRLPYTTAHGNLYSNGEAKYPASASITAISIVTATGSSVSTRNTTDIQATCSLVADGFVLIGANIEHFIPAQPIFVHNGQFSTRTALLPSATYKSWQIYLTRVKKHSLSTTARIKPLRHDPLPPVAPNELPLP